jgi:hypothetical protein
MARGARNYGLPRLTIREAAKTLGISPRRFMDWLVVAVRPTPRQWEQWRANLGPGLPEALIRLYLTQQAEWDQTQITDVTAPES